MKRRSFLKIMSVAILSPKALMDGITNGVANPIAYTKGWHEIANDFANQYADGLRKLANQKTSRLMPFIYSMR